MVLTHKEINLSRLNEFLGKLTFQLEDEGYYGNFNGIALKIDWVSESALQPNSLDSWYFRLIILDRDYPMAFPEGTQLVLYHPSSHEEAARLALANDQRLAGFKYQRSAWGAWYRAQLLLPTDGREK